MNDMSMNAVQAAPDAQAIVVFGRDNSRKPHASVFDQAHAELAQKAADLMGMHVLARDGGGARTRSKASARAHIRQRSSFRAFRQGGHVRLAGGHCRC